MCISLLDTSSSAADVADFSDRFMQAQPSGASTVIPSKPEAISQDSHRSAASAPSVAGPTHGVVLEQTVAERAGGRSLIVTAVSGSLPDDDILEMYFESAKKSGGGDIDSMITQPSGSKLITFAEEEGKKGFSSGVFKEN